MNRSVAVFLSCALPCYLSAFTASSQLRRQALSFTRTSSSLCMSDVPREESDKDTNNNNEPNDFQQAVFGFFKPPPPPEDMFVLTGDILALSVYGFADHIVSQDMTHQMVFDSKTNPMELQQMATDWGPPVWLDSTHSYHQHVLQVTLSDKLVTHYSPLLQQTSVAVCLLLTSWLLSGWWHEAFAVETTRNAERNLYKTGQTWLTSTALLVSVVAISHLIMEPVIFTKGDISFLLDTLTVMAMWRFMASCIVDWRL